MIPLPGLRKTAGPVREEIRDMQSSVITGTSGLSATGAG